MAKSFDSGDLKENRVLGGLGYLVFFVPLVACPKSAYGRYCANQGLILLIAQLLVWLVFGILTSILGWVPLVGWIIGLARKILHLGVFLVAAYLAYLACSKGDAREVPYFGKFNIIK